MLTAKQLEQRRHGIGSSEIAAVVGQSPYMGPMDVWNAKVAPPPDVDPLANNEAVLAGSFYEDGIARLYAKLNGVRLSGKPPTLAHPKHPWALATVDRFAVMGRDRKPYRVVEVKNVQSSYSASEWGEEGTDEIPPVYLIQVQHQLEIANAVYGGIDEAHVVVSMFGRAPKVYPLKRDAELGAALIEAGGRFWTGHVLTGVPPALDASDATQAYLRRRFPKSTGALVAASADSQRWFRQHAEASAAEKAAEKRKKEAAAHLQLEIGSNGGIEGPLGKATWNLVNGGTDWKAIATELGATAEHIERHKHPQKRPLCVYFKEE